jgi:hypothetical protein
VDFVICRKSRTRNLGSKRDSKPFGILSVPLMHVVSEEFKRIIGSFSNRNTFFMKVIAVHFVVI